MRFNNSPVGGLSCLKIPQELLPYALVSSQRMHSNWSKWAYILQIIFTEETNISRQNKKHLYLVPLVSLLRSCLWSLYTCKHLSFLHWISHLQHMHHLGAAEFLPLQSTPFCSCLFFSGAMLFCVSILKLLYFQKSSWNIPIFYLLWVISPPIPYCFLFADLQITDLVGI